MSNERLRSLKKVFELTGLLNDASRELEALWRTLTDRGREKEGIELLHLATLIRDADLCILARDTIIEGAAAFVEGKIPEEQFEDIFNRWKARMCDQCDGTTWVFDENKNRKPCTCASERVGKCHDDPAFQPPPEDPLGL